MTFVHKNRLRVLAALCVALMLAGIVGCGGGSEKAVFNSAADALVVGDEYSDESTPARVSSASQEAGKRNASGVLVAKDSVAKPSAVKRKIIYTADVALAVENLAPAQKKLLALVQKFDGYIADANIGGVSGAPRTGKWKVRIPAGSYDGFMDAVSQVGEVQTINSTSEDVSAEFYDVEARLRNKRVEENRLIDHLKNSTAKLTDILIVEREISRVRGEIERMQGRLRVLADLTALTTITVTLNEIKDYVPPAPPTFLTQISRTFASSLGGLGDFVKGIVLSLVALAPWLVILVPLGFVVWRIYKRAVVYVDEQPKTVTQKTLPKDDE